MTVSNAFNTVSRPWVATGVTKAQVLARIKGLLSYFDNYIDGSGTITDQYGGPYDGRTSSCYATAAFLVASTGDTTWVGRGTNAMTQAVGAYDGSTNQPSGGVNFVISSAAQAYQIARDNAVVSSGQLNSWSGILSQLNDVSGEDASNWSAYTMSGRLYQYKSALISHSTMVSEIENYWTNFQTHFIGGFTDGLYDETIPGGGNDGAGFRGSFSIDLAGRGNLSLIALGGYDGPSASAIFNACQLGASTALKLLSPDGLIAPGGRTSNHNWVQSVNAGVNQAWASYYQANGNPGLASQYQRAANLWFNRVATWFRGDGSAYVTTNKFNPSSRIGYQNASNFAVYNGNLLQGLCYLYIFAPSTPIVEAPCPSEIGGYVYTAPSNYAATVLNAGGVHCHLETQPATPYNGNLWNCLGITRIGAVGFDTRLGPGDGYLSFGGSSAGGSFAPAFNSGSWSDIANRTDYSAAVTATVQTPVLVKASIAWTSSGNPTLTQNLTITPDGILSRITGSGQIGTQLPLMQDDGDQGTAVGRTVAGGIASGSFPSGASSQSFIALNSDATLTVEGAFVTAFGTMNPVRAASAQSSNNTFVYPAFTGDPSAASVKSSITIGANGDFTSALGWVSGSLYRGRYAAGGTGSALAFSGSGTPELTLGTSCKFIVKLNGTSATSIETDTTTTATIGGQTRNVTAFTPLALTGVTVPSLSAPSMQISTPSSVQPGATFTITATVSNGSAILSSFTYRDDGGTAQALPSGATYTGGTLTFTHPGLSAGTHNVAVIDATDSLTATTSNFLVQTITESPNGTYIDSPGPQIIDATGNIYTISGGQVVINGVLQTVTNNVVAEYYINHTWYQKNAAGDFYDLAGYVPTDPTTGVTLIHNTTIPGVVSSGSVSWDHIVVIVEENHTFAEIVASAPYINGTLLPGGASFTNYSAISHPSEPNYFALYAGDTFGISDDNNYTEADPSLSTALSAVNKTFKGYIESGSPRKHNPWESFPEGTGVEADFSTFPTNFTTLPHVSWVIPNLTHDAHDGTVSQMDSWLQTNLSGYINWCVAHNSLFVLVTDEDDGSGNNTVMCLLYGANIIPGQYANSLNHYSLLRLLCQSFGAIPPRNAATATAFPSLAFGAQTVSNLVSQQGFRQVAKARAIATRRRVR